MDLTTAALLLLALALGALLGGYLQAQRGAVALVEARVRLAAQSEHAQEVRRSLDLHTADSARRQSGVVSEQVAGAVGPLQEVVGRLAEQVEQTERGRVDAYAGLREQVAGMAATSHQLSTQTTQLVSALRAPQVRGRWGEVQLQRVVELAGMVEHCDFHTQAGGTVHGGDHATGVRPDLVVRLSGGRQVVVDAKVPLAAYLDAVDADPASTGGRHTHLQRHAKALRAHVDALAAKQYWRAFEPSPEFVVLFVPGDAFLDAALSVDPGLLEHGFTRHVVLATPTTLVALLRTVAYSWRQESLSADAAAIHALGRELYTRLSTLGGHLDRLGGQLGRSVESFNAAVSSVESRVLVTARKLSEMNVSAGDAPQVSQVDHAPRRVQAEELLRG